MGRLGQKFQLRLNAFVEELNFWLCVEVEPYPNIDGVRGSSCAGEPLVVVNLPLQNRSKLARKLVAGGQKPAEAFASFKRISVSRFDICLRLDSRTASRTSPVYYSDWLEPDQPNKERMDCMSVGGNDGRYGWSSQRCERRLPFICENSKKKFPLCACSNYRTSYLASVTLNL